MADFRLDRIRYTWKGSWQNNEQYIRDDIVRFGGNTYVCLITHTSSSTNFYDDLFNLDTYAAPEPRWAIMTDGVTWTGDWTVGVQYKLNDIVKYKGIVYQCVTQHSSANTTQEGLEADQSKWKIVAKSSAWNNVWQAFTEYKKQDIVKYNGINYLCLIDHVSSTIAAGLENDSDKWTILSRSDQWKGEWTVSVRYREDDVVRYGGNVYRCIVGHTAENTNEEGIENDLGTDSTIPKWELVIEGINFLGDWTKNVRYRLNDIVRFGPNLVRAKFGHNSANDFDPTMWETWLPGLGFENEWSGDVDYQPGDIVVYGGYTYVSKKYNTNIKPTRDYDGVTLPAERTWEYLVESYLMKGDHDPLLGYRTGDVVRKNGYLYVAIKDVLPELSIFPGENSAFWELLITGIFYRGEWVGITVDPNLPEGEDSTAIIYYPGDVVVDAGTTYICKKQHEGNSFEARPVFDLDEETGANEYWTILGRGTPENVLRYVGDIKTYATTDDGSTLGSARLPIGTAGQVLKVQSDNTVEWEPLQQTQKVYFVSLDGIDRAGNGFTETEPFRTLKYASQYILADVNNRAPATIIVKTGIYQEILPIVIPADVAVVGDELRSTVITPAPGYEQSNMFYMRNGSGLRNCTLQGLNGELGDPNENLTRRPSAGAYVSLDPGVGPDSEYAWIINKSPYVQNVTTFGSACIGMKVDGDLHNGGNKSIVANDFTQILSDGIGYWVNGDGRSELVSVFTYYCHIGYLATNGGKVRATNGNNSYGLYGSVAEGYDVNEEPNIAALDNRTKEAQIESIYGNGAGVFGVAYTHCGQDYTFAAAEVTGPGSGANLEYDEFRDSSISEIRVTEEDSFSVGGNNYTFIAGSAQAGSTTTITLSGADEGTPETYVGQRIFIHQGAGVGQYAKIAELNTITRVVTVEKESNGEPGWESIINRPIATLLNESTKYYIEPRVIVSDPQYQATPLPGSGDLADICFAGSKWVGVGTNNTTYSTDGNSFSPYSSSPSGEWKAVAGNANGDTFAAVEAPDGGSTTIAIESNDSWSTANIPSGKWNDIVEGNNTWIAVGADGTGSAWNTVAVSSGGPQSMSSVTVPTSQIWTGIAYGNGTFVAISENSNEAIYSIDSGTTWTVSTLPATANWTAITYARDKFVALSSKTDSSRCDVAVSYDGITWYGDTMVTGEWTDVTYGNGLLIAVNSGTDIVALSQDGYSWREKVTFGQTIAAWGGIDTDSVGNYILVGGGDVHKVVTGPTAKARVKLGGGRVGAFLISEPGSNYDLFDDNTVTVYDNANTGDVTYEIRINNGVLPQPKIIDSGSGYLRASAEVISGDGFADIFQTGTNINFSNLTKLPGPGDNIVIDGIDDVVYFVTKINSSSGIPGDFAANIQISPDIGIAESPVHNQTVTLRSLYSQVRLTGHDFLDIGTGNFEDTNYPGLYVFGYESINEPQPFNETRLFDGGRVFYTSTDQDGNFRVGELFEVEQATGTISINAAFFDLGGLEELRLGGVVLGGTGAVVREFSTDPTFAANSNNIVPTQSAIAKYLESRLASGGSDPKVNRLNAGEVSVRGNEIFTATQAILKIEAPTKMAGVTAGVFNAMTYFASGGASLIQDIDISISDAERFVQH